MIVKKLVKQIVFVILFVSLLLIKPTFASENDVPLDVQSSIILKTFSYNRTIASKNVNLGIIINSRSNRSINVKNELLENINLQKAQTKNKVKVIIIDSIEELRNSIIDIAYITPDVSYLDEVAKEAKEKNILTWSYDSNNVKKGLYSISIANKNNRPRILINLKNSKLEGHDISSQLLKLCEIID